MFNQVLDLLPPAWAAFLRRHILVWSTIYLLLIVVLLVIFTRLAIDITRQDAIVTLDQNIADLFYQHSQPLVDNIFSSFTLLGSEGVIGLAAGVGIFLAWRREWLRFAVWVIAIGGGETLNLLLKALFTRARPVVDVPIVIARGYSFPSGHSMMSIITYGAIAYFIFLEMTTWRRRMAVLGFFAVLILLIGFSRIVLVVHFFSDVMGGFIIGGAWLSATLAVFERIRRRAAIRAIETARPDQAGAVQPVIVPADDEPTSRDSHEPSLRC